MHRLVCLSFLALVACSSSTTSSGTPDAPAADGGTSDASSTPASCADGTKSISLTATMIATGSGTSQLATHDVLDVLTTSTGPSILVRQGQVDGSATLSFVDQAGAVVPLANVAGIRTSNGAMYRLLASAVALGDKRCVAFAAANANLGFACEGSAAEDTGVKMGADKRLLAVPTADGGVIVVGQNDFAAYGVAMRSTSGVWSTVEKLVSSVTWGDDAVSYNGDVVTCVNGEGAASLDFGGSLITDTATVTGGACRIALGRNGLNVVNGDRYGVVPYGSLGQHDGSFTLQQTAAIATNDDLTALVLSDDKPIAVVRKVDGSLVAAPLAGGAPILREAATKTAYGIRWESTSNALRWVTAVAAAPEGTTAKETLTLTTRCTSAW